MSDISLRLPLVDYEHIKVCNNKRQVSATWGDFHEMLDKYQKTSSELETDEITTLPGRSLKLKRRRRKIRKTKIKVG